MKPLLALIALFFLYSSFAQEVKFGKVSKSELQETVYEKDSSAAAAILYRKVNIFFRYQQDLGFSIIRSVHERVKVYNKDGFKYATVAENLYKDGGKRETMGSLKGFTYNLEGSQIVKSKVKSSETFKTNLNKYRDEEKFTMPSVKEGSVIEYEYNVTSPFFWYIDEIPFQYDIPIKFEEVTLAIPEYYNFKTAVRGYLPLNPEFSTQSKSINVTTKADRQGGILQKAVADYNQGSIKYKENKTLFNLVNVPALKSESHSGNINNYRSAIKYELQYVKFPNSPLDTYSTTWEKVAKNIFESESFGGQLNGTKYFNDDLGALISGLTSDKEKAFKIFDFVQNRMTWNGLYGKYSDLGTKKAYNERKGNVADINLILVSMLKEAGLKAYPVLISTRGHGIPLFPTREGFDYVVSSVELDGEKILMDACSKFTAPDLLPVDALNWNGRLIKEGGISEEISLYPKQFGKEAVRMMVSLTPDGDVKGKLRNSFTGHEAFLYRDKYANVHKEDYREKLENAFGNLEITNLDVKNENDCYKPLLESYEFVVNGQCDVIGDKIYFSPMLFEVAKENPFKSDIRNYPIDFAYPRHKSYIINITIPEGYEVNSLPENTSVNLLENAGNFNYSLGKRGNTLQLKCDLKINSTIILPSEYEAVRDFYAEIIRKEAEQVVLSKV
ncbi:DUF3858 domain-containing protein [Flagellimonas sp. S174]|uniref:transglutaminase domain-containing protein n=1 Tax=Flagellimonas sp. S174 TaxID=3410790 RepID=UPI003BF59893